jgi:GntR family transcriptional regulator
MSERTFPLVAAPLYRQVEEQLARQIADGTYAPGTLLPSDAELCKMFGVSRITVRHAIDKLVASNLVRRQQGVGTHVVGADQAVKTASLVGYIDDVHPHINFKLLASEMRQPPATLATAMRLEPGALCRCFVNLNHVGSEPLSYVESFFPDAVASLLTEADFSAHIPPSRLVEMRSGRNFAHATQTMGAVAAPEEIARLLGLAGGQPLIRMERVYFATDGGVLEATAAHYHPQRYQFSIRLVPHGGAARDGRGGARDRAEPQSNAPPPEGTKR